MTSATSLSDIVEDRDYEILHLKETIDIGIPDKSHVWSLRTDPMRIVFGSDGHDEPTVHSIQKGKSLVKQLCAFGKNLV